MTSAQLTISLTLNVDNPAKHDLQALQDHLGQALEDAYRRLEAEGLVTPPDDAYGEVSVSLEAVHAEDTTDAHHVVCGMQDWRIGDSEEDMQPGDDAPFTLDAALGNACYLDVRCPSDDDKYLGIGIEISNGRPHVFITGTDGGDVLIHIAKSSEGLVVVPGYSNESFIRAPRDRYSYDGQSNAIMLRDPDAKTSSS